MTCPPAGAEARPGTSQTTADVAYATAESPLGGLLMAASGQGLVWLAYEDAHGDALLDDVQVKLGPLREDRRRLDHVRRALEAYFNGRLRAFDLTLDWRLAPGGFMRRALEATAAIPFGDVWTFQNLAAAAGNPRASRAAGTALARNPIAIIVPCHRVLRSNGTIGDDGGGPDVAKRKEHLLRLEGAWPRTRDGQHR
jgi:methylated-DNA-[protein]-cysteine S-methyltransferase